MQKKKQAKLTFRDLRTWLDFMINWSSSIQTVCVCVWVCITNSHLLLHIPYGWSWFSNKIENAWYAICCKFFLLSAATMIALAVFLFFYHKCIRMRSSQWLQWVTRYCSRPMVCHNNRDLIQLLCKDQSELSAFLLISLLCRSLLHSLCGHHEHNYELNAELAQFHFHFFYCSHFFLQ